MILPLFDTPPGPETDTPVVLGPGATLLPAFALSSEEAVLFALAGVIETSPLRHMETPGGHRMSVAMTNCGELGWVSARSGYRYTNVDPENGTVWPSMPEAFLLLATSAAGCAGYAGFVPNACLMNRYEVGTKLSLHRIRTKAISPSQSCRSRWDCPRPFFSVESGALIP